MTINNLNGILYSNRGNIQFAVLYDISTNTEIINGCSIDYIVANYGDLIIKHITAENNNLIITV